MAAEAEQRCAWTPSVHADDARAAPPRRLHLALPTVAGRCGVAGGGTAALLAAAAGGATWYYADRMTERRPPPPGPPAPDDARRRRGRPTARWCWRARPRRARLVGPARPRRVGAASGLRPATVPDRDAERDRRERRRTAPSGRSNSPSARCPPTAPRPCSTRGRRPTTRPGRWASTSRRSTSTAPSGTCPAWWFPARRTRPGPGDAGPRPQRHATRDRCAGCRPFLASGRARPGALLPQRRRGRRRAPTAARHLGATEWEDVAAACAWALGHGARSLVLFGLSMGGACVSERCAARTCGDRVAGVVLEAPVLDWGPVLRSAAVQRGLPAAALPLLLPPTMALAGRPRPHRLALARLISSDPRLRDSHAAVPRRRRPDGADRAGRRPRRGAARRGHLPARRPGAGPPPDRRNIDRDRLEAALRAGLPRSLARSCPRPAARRAGPSRAARSAHRACAARGGHRGGAAGGRTCSKMTLSASARALARSARSRTVQVTSVPPSARHRVAGGVRQPGQVVGDRVRVDGGCVAELGQPSAHHGRQARVDRGRRGQHPDGVGPVPTEPPHGRGVEARDAVRPVVPVEHRCDGLLEPAGAQPGRLDLDHDGLPGQRSPAPAARVGTARRCRARRPRARRSVERPRDRAHRRQILAGEARQHRVVDDDRDAVAGQHDVEFDAVPGVPAAANAASEFSGTPSPCRPRWASGTSRSQRAGPVARCGTTRQPRRARSIAA